jgi:hypothetical protein
MITIFRIRSKWGKVDLCSRGTDDQRKKMGLVFDLTKTCAKFHPKILTLSASNLGAKNTQMGMPGLKPSLLETDALILCTYSLSEKNAPLLFFLISLKIQIDQVIVISISHLP